ncbi:hypothetical protein [Pseudolactococcus carnosus]|uniref:hypothetical protein n=1 Tax=Pseudolactococcus carnosus TaxID=2749961 RepID=UPI001FB9E103|nr:hypothetical protein [Lactococcus carnosus]
MLATESMQVFFSGAVNGISVMGNTGIGTANNGSGCGLVLNRGSSIAGIEENASFTSRKKQSVLEMKCKVSAKSNPHSITKIQIGLPNFDNIQQASKSSFDSHTSKKSNPHTVTASQVGAYSKTETYSRAELDILITQVKLAINPIGTILITLNSANSSTYIGGEKAHKLDTSPSKTLNETGATFASKDGNTKFGLVLSGYYEGRS